MRSPSRSRPRNGSRESNQRPKLTSQPPRPPPTGPAASIGLCWFARPAPKRAISSDYCREPAKLCCKSQVCVRRIWRRREPLQLRPKSCCANPCDRIEATTRRSFERSIVLEFSVREKPMQVLETPTTNVISFSPLLRRYTLEEFWDLPEPEDRAHYELIGGYLFMVPP